MINNPLIRIIGIIAVIYFALFYNTEKKNSLGTRFSKEKIKQNVSYIKDKTIFIKNNIGKSKQHKALAGEDHKINDSYKDLEMGSGKEVSCGSVIMVNYTKLGGKSVLKEDSKYFEINDQSPAKYLVGMKEGGVRRVESLEEENGVNISYVYDISLIKIINNNKNDQKCD